MKKYKDLKIVGKSWFNQPVHYFPDFDMEDENWYVKTKREIKNERKRSLGY